MKQKSLLLITVDCWRADHAGFHGYDRGTTPFLDSLAPKSFVLPKAVVAGAPTFFSFPAIMASRYALGLGRDVVGIAPQEPTLATSLQDAGYATAAFVAGNPYLCPRFGYHQGFTTFRDFLSTPPPSNRRSEPGGFTRLNQALQRASRNHVSASAAYDELYFRYCQWRVSRQSLNMDQLRRYPAADVIVDQARSWLSGVREEPFFIWLHLMDPHHPYFPPEQALSELGCGNIDAPRAAFVNAYWSREDIRRKRILGHKQEILSLYDAGIYWVDKQISRLVTALKHLRRWDETVLAVTGDHGEEFLEKEARYHAPTNLSESLVHVPLLIRVPGEGGVRQPDVPFSLIHLAPTLLDILHFPQPETFHGRSLWAQMKEGRLEDAPAVIECVHGCKNPFPREHRLGARLLAVRDARYKLVINFHEQTECMFDLANDPSESAPLDENVCKPERARLLRVALQHLRSTRGDRDQELRLRARIREIQQLAMRINEQEGEVAVVSA